MAVEEKELLRTRFQELSSPQRVALKSLYGVPLDETRRDEYGFTEIEYWSAQQGEGQYDHLGYLQGVRRIVPYTPQQYEEAWAICGRRWGKTDAISSMVVAYEAVMGGHEAYVRPGQPVICFQIAQDLRMAKYSLHLIKATLESSPAMAAQIKDVTADRIDLKNGLTIVTVPPTLKSVRGYANPVAVLDEVGVWYQDSDSANPDYEIYRAVKPAQAQFPNRKVVGISSPWNKAGLLFQYFEAGTAGEKARESEKERFAGCLVVHSPTGASGNPRVSREFLKVEASRDPRAFEREYLAVFQDSISGFLNSQRITEAIAKGTRERAPQPNFYYVAAIDPAFRHDAFALTIMHADPERGIVQDLIRRWQAVDGFPVDPGSVIREISSILRAYRIPNVYSDQYQLESLQFIATQFGGFSIEGVDFTGSSKAEIYGSLQSLLNQRRISLLDDPDLVRELRSLERKLQPGGNVQILAPQGFHDDLATVTALAAYKATWFLPAPPRREPVQEFREKTPFERMQEQIARKRREVQVSNWD